MGGTYRSDRIPIHGPPATGRCHASPRVRTRQRGDASSPCARTRHRPPRLLTGKQGTASSSRAGTRRCIVFQQENEATPRLPASVQGVASSSSRRTRRRLISSRENEATPRLLARERGVVLPRGETTPLLRFECLPPEARVSVYTLWQSLKKGM
ncbi:hypothetical protein GW17_00017117 [Ensete ventricosum]|nr:hypothetical protein GW17_00017117 [Ensete ventricosum]